jgi:hypothetical protein
MPSFLRRVIKKWSHGLFCLGSCVLFLLGCSEKKIQNRSHPETSFLHFREEAIFGVAENDCRPVNIPVIKIIEDSRSLVFTEISLNTAPMIVFSDSLLKRVQKTRDSAENIILALLAHETAHAAGKKSEWEADLCARKVLHKLGKDPLWVLQSRKYLKE